MVKIYCTIFYEQTIPAMYTRTKNGENISPPLQWENAPTETKSFAIILEDIDIPIIGSITHWIMYNIPPTKRDLVENIPIMQALPDGSIQGKNFYRRNGYLGPNPLGGRHTYLLTIYALISVIEDEVVLSKRKLMKVIDEHLLVKSQITFYYEK